MILKTISFTIFISFSFFSSAQVVGEIVEKYNYEIDPNNRLDSITHLKVDIFQSISSPKQDIFLVDTTTNFYSVFGENSYANWSDGKKVDMNYMSNVSSWETKNIIKNHICRCVNSS